MVHQRHEQRVETDHGGELPLAEFFDEAGDVTRIGNQDVVVAADHHAHAVRRECIDMIKRQRRDHHLRALLKHWTTLGALLAHAGIDLLHVGDQIAMRQHRTLGQPRGATGVLQHSDVIQLLRHLLHPAVTPQLQCPLEADSLGQPEWRDQLLDLVNNGVDQPPLGRGLHVTHLHFNQMFDGGVREHFLHQFAKHIEVHHCLGTRVLELMAHLARGVQRVGVDHDQTGTHRTEYSNRVLQQVGHLHGDTVTRHQLRVLLQISGERG
ncbi:hypothetical protein AN901_200301 [Pseudomonas syringae pv. theae]|nr:hypothetical protein AN901_200301 [Pseudomonas syringae pv. theae]